MVQVRDNGGMDWNGSIEVAKKYMDLRAHLGGKIKKKTNLADGLGMGREVEGGVISPLS